MACAASASHQQLVGQGTNARVILVLRVPKDEHNIINAMNTMRTNTTQHHGQTQHEHDIRGEHNIPINHCMCLYVSIALALCPEHSDFHEANARRTPTAKQLRIISVCDMMI